MIGISILLILLMSYVIGASFWLGYRKGRNSASFRGLRKGKHNVRLVKNVKKNL